MSVLISVLATLNGVRRSRAALHLEVLALRHQLHVLQRSRPRRLRLAKIDRWLWAWLSRSSYCPKTRSMPERAVQGSTNAASDRLSPVPSLSHPVPRHYPRPGKIH
jgi:hypothetical protein